MTMNNSPTENLGMRQVLGIPNYRFLWSGQVISNFGDSLTNLGLLILVNELTGSTAALALMAIVIGLPKVIFGMLAGVYVDRIDRKRIMVWSDVIRAVVVLGFMMVTTESLLWLLYAIAFTQSSIGTLFNPARNAIIPNIVPANGLMSANALIQTSALLVGVLGAGTAGLIIGVFDTYTPIFLIDSLTFLVSALLITRLQLDLPAVPLGQQESTAKVWHQLTEGVQILFSNRLLSGTLVAAGVAMLGLGAINILMVPFLVDDLKLPETWFGAVQFAQVSAMVISSVFVAAIARRFLPTQIITTNLAVVGVIVAAVATVTNIWPLFVLLFVLGLVMTPLQAAISTILQTAVEDNMRGRVAGALDTLVQSATLLSMAFAGIFGDLMGIRETFVLGGMVVVLSAVAAGRVFGKPGAIKPPLEPTLVG
jgi:MFS family permease